VNPTQRELAMIEVMDEVLSVTMRRLWRMSGAPLDAAYAKDGRDD
jgi:hypothetical protein